MWILGLESSCDETAAALYQPATGRFVERIARQLTVHAPYGGVVPELASRCHLETIAPLTHAVCGEAGIALRDIALVGATAGPGLAGALIVGLSYGKALAAGLGVPFVAVNHIEAHMYAAGAEADVRPPFLALVISGGHTLLVDIHDTIQYTVVGRTRDDAAGEAFDKGAKILGLGYPGGQALQELARAGNAAAIAFPRAMLHDESWDFSFSGLKTALVYFRRDHPDATPADIAASYQEAIVDVLVRKTLRAAAQFRRATVVLGGGVTANARLRERFLSDAAAHGVRAVLPSFALCTDNARMIAYRAGQVYTARGASPLDADIFPAFVSPATAPNWHRQCLLYHDGGCNRRG
jgi:N6-L-threonylcarbamoyladenine synthase